MADADLAVASASFLAIYYLLKNKKEVIKKKRRWWLKRKGETKSSMLKNILTEKNSHQFESFTRMSRSDFSFLLNSIREKISRKDTDFRKAVSPEERLAVTLRFLATGDNFSSLQPLFNISKQSMSTFVPEVCRAIIECLKDYTKMPLNPDEWKSIADTFNETWDFPNCIGAVDGKHVILHTPAQCGTKFGNRKSQYSIVLMAIVDANYNFIFVNIGAPGRVSEEDVFENCELYRELQRGNLPEPSALFGREMKVPYVLLGDAAFPLDERTMKPHSGIHLKGSPKQIFNDRLSRARRVAENAFGIAASVFRVLRKPTLLQPDKMKLIVTTVISLHNFLRKSETSRNIYTPAGFVDSVQNGEIISGSWRNDESEMTSLLPLQNASQDIKLAAEKVQGEFTEYFCTSGSVPWQSH